MRKPRHSLSFAVLLAAVPAFAAGAAPAASSGTLTLAQVLDAVRRDNPELLAALQRRDAARARVAQAATPDQPRVDLERKFAPGSVLSAPEKSVAVTQSLPFPTTLALRRGRAARESDIAEQDYRAEANAVTARARRAYARLFLAEKSLRIYEENIAIMRGFARAAESKYAAGRATQLDALKAQVELTRMLDMSVVLDSEAEIGRAELNALLGRDASSALAPTEDPNPGTLDLKLDDLRAEALARRPELRAAFLNAERARDSLAIARSSFLPDLMLQYRWRDDPARGRTQDAAVGVTVPLWFWKPAAMTAEARAGRDAADAELRAATVETSADLQTAWERAVTARRLAESDLTSVLPQTDEALKVAESGYQADRAGFLDLLDAQRTLLGVRLDYYRDLAEYEQRLADLARIVGREL
jgi:outer membrane protein TolC